MRFRGPSVFAVLFLALFGCKGGGGVTAESFPVDSTAPALQKDEGRVLLSKFARAGIEFD